MSSDLQCPKCSSPHVYRDGNMWMCPECGNEFSASSNDKRNSITTTTHSEDSPENSVRDAFGIVLNNGDAVTVIKELRIKGSSSAVKAGTRVKNIRLVDSGDGHDISCKIDGIGSINLKSEFVKKA